MDDSAQFREVSHEEFRRFVDDYPSALVGNACGISEPPLVSYNDFTGGRVWPASMVAKYHDGHPRKYWIREAPPA